jgi:hypothetical protein
MPVCIYAGKAGDVVMSKRMTVVFHDDDLYTNLKVEAAIRNKPASYIVAEAVKEWLESREDAELLPVIEEARGEWKEKGGRPWSQVEQELESAVSRRERKAKRR